jgi:YggT family protein
VQTLASLLISVLYLFYLFMFAIFIRSVLSWFPMSPNNPIKAALDQITEPVLGPLRRYLPSFGMLDLSPMIAIIIIIVVIRVLESWSRGL